MTTTSAAHTDTHDDHLATHGKVYLIILASLLVLTGITVAASYVDLGSFNIVVALVIATIKASLVGLFFMHLLYDKPINGMVLVAGFMFLALLLSFCLLDVENRTHIAPTNKSVPSATGIMPPEPVAPPENPK